MESDASKPLDPAVLQGLRREEGGEELVGRLVALFLEHAPKRVREVEKHLRDRDGEGAASAAHALRGSALNVGAQSLAAGCAELEERLQVGELEAAAALVPQLARALADTEAALRAEAGQPVEPEARERPVVLVADDDEHIRKLIEINLSDAGYDVVAARDGQEAVQLAAERYPDAAVLDVNMPGVDGYKIAERLRQHRALGKIGIIMVSARTGDADILQGFEAGADDYVTKPFNLQELCARLQAVLERR
jgi:CheY-like chemotaxis protein